MVLKEFYLNGKICCYHEELKVHYCECHGNGNKFNFEKEIDKYNMEKAIERRAKDGIEKLRANHNPGYEPASEEQYWRQMEEVKLKFNPFQKRQQEKNKDFNNLPPLKIEDRIIIEKKKHRDNGINQCCEVCGDKHIEHYTGLSRKYFKPNGFRCIAAFCSIPCKETYLKMIN